MKTVKDDGKVMGPMFPRLHVNDTEKGGPRAPPRNKMALYEQLSIPSQKFNPSFTNTNKTTNATLQASTSEATGFKRKLPSLLQFPSHTPPHQIEKSSSNQYDGTELSAPSKQSSKRKKVEEDDFRVPVYVGSRTSQLNNNTLKSTSIEKLSSAGSKYSGSDEIQNNCHLDSQKTVSICTNMGRDGGSLHADYRKDLKNENHVHSILRKPSAVQLSKSTSSRTTTGNLDGCSRGDASQGYKPLSENCRLHDSDIIKRKAGSRCNGAEHDDGLVDSTMAVQGGCIHVTIGCFDSKENATNITKANGIEKHGTKMRNSFHPSNLEKSDSVSNVSLVNAVSSMDISPDDVVGIIGQKHFLKARRVIANQQRLFAVQVFELHRLIKMQQLIAGSPELLVEDAILLGKPSSKMSPAKKIPLGYVVKLQPRNIKRNDISENPSDKMESSAENGVGKPSLSSARSGDYPYYYPPSSENAQLANMAADCKMGRWCSSQFSGHQWLIPVMSPSEGLVYKPYPGTEYPGFFYGGSGPYGPASFTGVVSGNQPVAYSYFPHYGAPFVTSTESVTGIEQLKNVGHPDSLSKSNQFSAGGSNSAKHHIHSAQNQITGAAPHVMKFQSSKESKLLGSTASSPGDIVPGAVPREITQGLDSRRTEQQMRVIKVVPHNRGSATESAARIFQSIREERKRLDNI